MSNSEINNSGLGCLDSKLVRQRDIEDLANASEVTITFDQMTEKEAYYLLRMLRQDNSGYHVKRPRSISMEYEISTEENDKKLLAKRNETWYNIRKDL